MQPEFVALITYRVEKAEADLATAQQLLASDRYAQAANRAYYAMFHVTRALLAQYETDSKRHSTVIGKFHQLFVKTGIVSIELNAILNNAFQTRLKCDYDDFYVASKFDAQKQVENAVIFVN
ncbi:MAG: HEPN domain-containing protein [Bacillota bacterium]